MYIQKIVALSISITSSNRTIDISSDILQKPRDFKIFIKLYIQVKESKQYNTWYIRTKKVTF
jgi:hypothetical protein